MHGKCVRQRCDIRASPRHWFGNAAHQSTGNMAGNTWRLYVAPLIVMLRMSHMARQNFMAPYLSEVQNIPFGVEEY
jgi:hypothetical protein